MMKLNAYLEVVVDNLVAIKTKLKLLFRVSILLTKGTVAIMGKRAMSHVGNYSVPQFS